ncbi:MAG TPA: hypothetical protein VFI34_08920 [Candidatus Limnocylindrales bacterium]|nr:hypothetical protein [Candidatus Limnocylindrales bacterium]
MATVTAPRQRIERPATPPVLPLLPVVATGAAVAAGWLAGSDGHPAAWLALAVVAAAATLVTARALDHVRVAARSFRGAGLMAFRRELDRSRRHRRSFTLVRLTISGPIADVPAGEADGIAESTIRLLGSALRITDSAWVQDGHLVVLLPESTKATARAFVERAFHAAPDRFGPGIGIAQFPDDGMTSGALLEAARRELLGQDVPRPISTAPATGVTLLDPANERSSDGIESALG